MQNTYTIRIVPLSQPTVIRSCPKCGKRCEYESTGNFRVNANQSLIDIWLIYQCKKCKSTWNMEILSRIRSKTIEKELYLKFLQNDSELALHYAFDITAHSKNKSVLSYEGILYEIISSNTSLPALEENFQLEIICEYPLDIRVDKILSQMFDISRQQMKKMCRIGKITATDCSHVEKAKVKNGMLLCFNS